MEEIEYIEIKNAIKKINIIEGKTFLITGATGMLASRIIDFLMEFNKKNKKKKCKIIGIARNHEKVADRFKNYEKKENLKFLYKNILEPITIHDTLDYIIHAASLASPKYYGICPIQVIEPNVIGVKNLLDLAKDKKVKSVLFFSSGEVYGINKNHSILDESSFGYLNPMNIRSCYAESKRMGENICASYFMQYKIPVKIVRPFHTYGPGMDINDGRVFADFVKNILSNQDIEIKSDGSARRPFCYISDAIAAFLVVLINGENGEAYNIANPYQEFSVRQLAKKLIQLFPERKLKVKFVEQDTVYSKSKINMQVVNIDKVMKLGWKPGVGIEDGFKRTINYFESETINSKKEISDEKV